MRSRKPDIEADRIRVWRRWTDGPLLVIGIGSVPIMLLELIREDLSRGDRVFVWGVTILVAVTFTADYVVELTSAEDRREFVRSEWISAAIVVSSLVSLVPAIAFVGSARLVRLTPALRGLIGLVRMFATGGLMAREGRRTLRRNTLRVATAVAGLTWISSAVTFRIAERTGTFFDALWWSAATITTVGYGDLYPVTAAGRAAGLVAMIVGITSFGVLTARLAAFLSQDEDET